MEYRSSVLNGINASFLNPAIAEQPAFVNTADTAH